MQKSQKYKNSRLKLRFTIITKDRSKLLIFVVKIEMLGELTTSSDNLFHKDMILTAKKLARAFILEIGTFSLSEFPRVIDKLLKVKKSLNSKSTIL